MRGAAALVLACAALAAPPAAAAASSTAATLPPAAAHPGAVPSATAPAATSSSSAPRSWLVLPFDDARDDPTLAWLAIGLAHTLGERLRDLGAAPFDDDARALALETAGFPATASPSLGGALDLGRQLRAEGGAPDRLVLGRFTVRDGSITLAARALDLLSEKARPWVTRQGRLGDLLPLCRDLADALAAEARLAVPAAAPAAPNDPPLLAFETYSRAVAESDPDARLALLRRALDEFPAYARAAREAAALLLRQERRDEAALILEKARSLGGAADPALEELRRILAAAVAAAP